MDTFSAQVKAALPHTEPYNTLPPTHQASTISSPLQICRGYSKTGICPNPGSCIYAHPQLYSPQPLPYHSIPLTHNDLFDDPAILMGSSGGVQLLPTWDIYHSTSPPQSHQSAPSPFYHPQPIPISYNYLPQNYMFPQNQHQPMMMPYYINGSKIPSSPPNSMPSLDINSHIQSMPPIHNSPPPQMMIMMGRPPMIIPQQQQYNIKEGRQGTF